MRFFDAHREGVFFSRQLEVIHEDKFFHWLTNRALNELVEGGQIRLERTETKTGTLNLVWNRSYRYPRRRAKQVIELHNEYADPNISGAIGLQGEYLALDGFAGLQFVMRDREVRAHAGREWTETEHDMDFIFERDGMTYGVEVKNTLGYMDKEELDVKVKLCAFLGMRPVFVVRMLPKTWIEEVRVKGGFCLVLKYQLYPWAHRNLAKRVAGRAEAPGGLAAPAGEGDDGEIRAVARPGTPVNPEADSRAAERKYCGARRLRLPL